MRHTDPIPLILDVDTGVDDALALLYAAASPEVSLVAATCVMGNVHLDTVVANTLGVLELAGLGTVEVAAGAARPLTADHEPFPEVHGDRGLGRAAPPPARAVASDRSATRVIVDTARARPGEVLLVATGPLTNVAIALEEEPALPSLLRGLALMGGAYAQAGNATPAAEANIWVDPEAAGRVFGAFAGAATLPVCVGLDVTEEVRMTREDLDAVCAPAPSSPLATFLQDAVPFYIEFYERTRSFSGAAMHDPLAMAVAIDPSLATLRATRVQVECDGRWTRGMTVTDLGDLRLSPWPGAWEQSDNARVALAVDAPAFTRGFNDRLRSLVRARA
jgi:purine nucleosidase